MTAEKVVTEKTFAEILEAATEEARRMDAPLSVRLQAVADTVRELSPPFADVIDRLVARLADNGVGVTAPQARRADAAVLCCPTRRDAL